MAAYKLLTSHLNSMQLTEIDLRFFTLLNESPCDVYVFNGKIFEVVISMGTELSKDFFKSIINSGHTKFFVTFEGKERINTTQQKNLVEVTRSLSVGDPTQKIKRQIQLLNLNLSNLYLDPTIDSNLELQFQSVKNLCHFLVKNPKLYKSTIKNLYSSNYHYVLNQPLLSSFLLLAFLKSTFHFSEKDIEGLFLTSYFKDIGMSLLPNEAYDKKELTAKEKDFLKNHADKSYQILDGRIPLSTNYLEIIQNHHTHTALDQSDDDDEHIGHTNNVSGIESVLVSVMDSIAAMTCARPYREKKTLFEALEVTKKIMSARYPQEFKLLVSFFQNFLSK